jgi:hypothetical protein
MKVRFSFTLEIDPDVFANAWLGQILEAEDIRPEIVAEVIMAIEELELIQQTGAKVNFTYLGGQEKPWTNPGWTLRRQRQYDAWG